MGELKKHQPSMTIDEQIEMLFDKYEKVDIKTMGFPEEWKRLLKRE